jgi:hypothetical protein
MSQYRGQPSFEVISHDGFSGRVVNVKLFGHLSYNNKYSDDVPPVLNKSYHLLLHFLSHLFVSFGRLVMLNVIRLHLRVNYLYFGIEGGRCMIALFNQSKHSL